MAEPQVFELFWLPNFIVHDVKTLEQMAQVLDKAAEWVRSAAADGVALDAFGTTDAFARLITMDPEVADRLGMRPAEYDFGEDGEFDAIDELEDKLRQGFGPDGILGDRDNDDGDEPY